MALHKYPFEHLINVEFEVPECLGLDPTTDVVEENEY